MTASGNSTSFSQSELTVNPGDRLTVSKQAGGVYAHNVHFPDTATSCPATPTTEAWTCEHDFTRLGDFDIHCDLHTYMTATVHGVEPGSGGPPPGSPPPGGPAPPGTTPAQDLVAPVLGLSGARLQRVLRQRAVVVRVEADEPATLTATGTVSVPPAARPVRLRKATAASAAGQSVKLRLRLSRKALAAVKRGLAVRRRLRASVRVTATDAAGNRTSTLRRIALRR